MKIKVQSPSSIANSSGPVTTDSTGFKVKAASFEGPLDILLELIEKRKLFIGDIALAKITDDFIEYIRQFSPLPVSDSANFILIASTLLLIKSKSLLPSLTLSDEEQTDISDLNKRLSILSKIKELSVKIRQIYLLEPLFETTGSRKTVAVFAPDKQTNIKSLHESIFRVITSVPKIEKPKSATIRQIISLEEMIDNLTKRVNLALKITFKEFSKVHNGERVNIIVSFLAMLELFKQGTIHVVQENNFSDIHIESKSVSVPRYN